ncbi:hypothetical protein ACUOA5_33390 [Escherichia coli]
MPALNSGHTVSKISHPQQVWTFCHELTVYAVACGNGFPADGCGWLILLTVCPEFRAGMDA